MKGKGWRESACACVLGPGRVGRDSEGSYQSLCQPRPVHQALLACSTLGERGSAETDGPALHMR